MRLRARAVLLLLAGLLLSGCWSHSEPEQLAPIDVAAYDVLPSGEVRWTVEMPRAVETGAAAIRQGGAGGRPAVLAQGTGATPSEAEQQLARLVGRQLFWSHTDFFLIGEQAAQQGIGPLLDFLSRRYRVRRNSLLFVARGPAADLLTRVDPGLEETAADLLRNLTRAVRPLGIRAVDANSFLRRRDEPGVDPVTPALAARPAERGVVPAPAGLAAFRGDRLAAILPEDAAMGVYWLRGEVGTVDMSLPCPGPAPEGRRMAVRVFRAGSRVSVAPGALSATVRFRVTAAGELLEWDCGRAITMDVVAAIEQAVADHIRQQALRALDLARAHGVDPVGLGLHLYRRDPGLWAALGGDGSRPLPGLTPEVTVQFVLRGTGLLIAPP